MSGVTEVEIRRALTHANGCAYLLTSSCNGKRGGIIATSAQLCGFDPPLICIAARKGHGVNLYMRDSQCFGLCCLPASNRMLIRRFCAFLTPDASSDPFDDIEMDRLTSTAPIVKRCLAAIDCRVFRQFDLETDHELIIGLVQAVRINAS